MSRPEVERFTADFAADPALAEAFTALGDDPEGWVRLAREKGYDLTLEEAQGLISSQQELSDDELEEVAGGWDGSGSGTGGTTGGEGGGG